MLLQLSSVVEEFRAASNPSFRSIPGPFTTSSIGVSVELSGTRSCTLGSLVHAFLRCRDLAPAWKFLASLCPVATSHIDSSLAPTSQSLRVLILQSPSSTSTSEEFRPSLRLLSLTSQTGCVCTDQATLCGSWLLPHFPQHRSPSPSASLVLGTWVPADCRHLHFSSLQVKLSPFLDCLTSPLWNQAPLDLSPLLEYPPPLSLSQPP
jgi:hypothetical protein